MLYVMLVGYFPFDGDTHKEMFEAIKRKKFDFDDKQWNNISNEAKDLIKHMLCDEDKRYNVENVLNHPWLSNFKEKNISSKKFHLFTKAENVMLSKTFIDYRKANYEDLKGYEE